MPSKNLDNEEVRKEAIKMIAKLELLAEQLNEKVESAMKTHDEGEPVGRT